MLVVETVTNSVPRVFINTIKFYPINVPCPSAIDMKWHFPYHPPPKQPIIITNGCPCWRPN